MNSPIPPQDEPPSGRLSDAQHLELLNLVRQNKKIEALKRYREFVPALGLAEAKAVVEAQSGPSAAEPVALDDSCESPAFRGTGDTDLLSNRKFGDTNRITALWHFYPLGKSKLAQRFHER